jgi:hypothetical protein
MQAFFSRKTLWRGNKTDREQRRVGTKLRGLPRAIFNKFIKKLTIYSSVGIDIRASRSVLRPEFQKVSRL